MQHWLTPGSAISIPMVGHDALSIAWLATTVLVAAIARAMTGWAFSVVAVPALCVVFPPMEAVVLNVLLALAATAKHLPAVRIQVRRDVFLPLLFSGLIGTPLGYLMQRSMEAASLRIVIGVVVLLLSVAMAAVAAARPRPAHPATRLLWLAGLASGAMGGAVGIAGPPVVLLFIATATDMEQSRATLGLGLFLVCLIAACVFAANGQVTAPVLLMTALALPVVLVGERLGSRLLRRYGKQSALKVSIGLTMAVGLTSVARGVLAMMH